MKDPHAGTFRAGLPFDRSEDPGPRGLLRAGPPVGLHREARRAGFDGGFESFLETPADLKWLSTPARPGHAWPGLLGDRAYSRAEHVALHDPFGGATKQATAG